MEHYKNFSLENITEEIDGILYEEEWKGVTDFEGMYEVSSFGRVKSLSREIYYQHSNGSVVFSTKKTIIMRQYVCEGYLKIDLYDNLFIKKVFVHILVAKLFIKNQYNKPEVNHKKGDRKNNFKNELEWVTSSENTKHAYEVLNVKRRGKDISKRKAKVSREKIYCQNITQSCI